MVSLKICALFLCALASGILFLDAKPVDEDHQKNAFDKIIKADIPYDEFVADPRHEVDMVLPQVIEPSRKKRGSPATSNAPSQLFRATQLWPGGVIPYTIDPTLINDSKYVRLIEEAIKEYQAKTCIRFVKRTRERSYLNFYHGPGCQSDVGYKGPGHQALSLGKDCDDISIVIHEIGHAIGLIHEQNRPDRDRYVNVLWNNILGNMQRAYTIKNDWHPDSIKTPYDYYSVMHYGNKDFQKNRKLVTMISRTPGITSFGGNQLTALDAQRIRTMYRCPEFPDFPRDFYWSHNGRGIQGKTCVKMDEPRDSSSWNNNYLCYRSQGKRPLNMRWSNSGPINGMACTKISDGHKSASTSWDNNYLCLPPNAPYKFKWLESRPSAEERRNCRRINDPYDRDWSRGYHYLCATDRETDKRDGQWSAWAPWGQCTRDCGTGHRMRIRDCNNPSPANAGKSCVGLDYERGECNTQPCSGLPKFPEDFSYVYNPFSLPSGHCLRTYELRSYLDWIPYYLCTSKSKGDPGIQWSYNGRMPGKRCTKIYNPIENIYRRGSWMNNYLCVPPDSPYHFVWSIKGPIKGLPCIRWYARNGARGWDKTYLCNQKKPKNVYAYHNR